MNCADHPDRKAVAIIKSEHYNSEFGVCDECYKKHKIMVDYLKDKQLLENYDKTINSSNDSWEY
jgi:hypothetical protein